MGLSEILGAKPAEPKASPLMPWDAWRMKLESISLDESMRDDWREAAVVALAFGRRISFEVLHQDGWRPEQLFGMAIDGDVGHRPRGIAFRRFGDAEVRYRAGAIEVSQLDRIAGKTSVDRVGQTAVPWVPIWTVKPPPVPEHLKRHPVVRVCEKLAVQWIGDAAFRLHITQTNGNPLEIDLNMDAISKLLASIGRQGKAK